MKKAVITSGSKQYLVQEGDSIEVELLKSDSKKVSFEPLMIIDDTKVQIGRPVIASALVEADIEQANKASEKVTSIRFKAKKRVRKVRGHRQSKSLIKITKIAA